MAGIINTFVSKYDYLMNDLADERSKDLPLAQRPFTIIAIVVLYLQFCTKYGPNFMKNRKAFELKYPIMLYNIFQVLFSAYLVNEGILYLMNANFLCDPVVRVNPKQDPRLMRAAWGTWCYFFAKNTELLDTIFFVFRKKSRQISTLHLSHHAIVVVSSWIFVKYYPSGPIVLVGTVNSFVHIIMYSYYFVTGLGPQYQKNLWWKKYITILQLVQFGLVIAHNMVGFCVECDYPKWLHLYVIASTGYIAFMFAKFYYNTYIKVQPKKSDETKANGKTSINRRRISVGQ